MNEVKITDLVPQETIDEIIELDSKIHVLLETYVTVAKELAKGIDIPIKNMGDLEKAEKLLLEKTKEALIATEQLNSAMEEKNRVIGQATNVVARQLMERERLNKAERVSYTDTEKFKTLLEKVNGSYEERVKRLVQVEEELKAAKKEEKNLNDMLKKGSIDQKQYTESMTELKMQTRSLAQEKSDLTTHLKNEEREMQTVETSYRNCSQRLELMKKAYKDLTDEERSSPLGQEMIVAIQNLDAHLKDMAADMGEHQRNVGNYAIASQNGVVSIESVNKALSQEAVTMQDVSDQTKILEEAKLMLKKSDVNYQDTLDRINSQLEENKRKLTDVSDILGKESKSVSEAEAQNKRLSEAIKHIDLSSEGAAERIKEMRNQIERNNDTIEEATGGNEEFADSMLSLIGVNSNFGSSLQGLSSSGNFLDGIHTKTIALSKTLLGLLANPWVLAFLGIAGIAAGVKWWYDYNKGLVEATKLTHDFTGLTGNELKGVRNEVQAVADVYNKDFRETLEAANALSKQFGISTQESLKLMEDGFASGADVNGEFLENIKEYPAYFKEAGLSASEFIAITTQANKAGIYSDKGIDVIKEGNLRIREMTKATAEALEGIGISSKKVQQELADGSKTTFDIMQEVSEKLAEFPEASSEVGTALADIFGGPGEDAGLQYILMLKDIDTNLDNVKERSGELAKLQNEQLQSQIELENAISAVFDMTGGSFESMTTRAKTFVNKGLVAIIKGCVSIVNWFIKMYNANTLVKLGFQAIATSFKNLWDVGKRVLSFLGKSFKNFGDGLIAVAKTVESILSGDWGSVAANAGKIKDAFLAQLNNLKGSVAGIGKDIGRNYVKGFTSAINGSDIKEISFNFDEESFVSPSKSNNGGTGKKTGSSDSKDGGSGRGSRTKQEVQKAAQEELKILEQLEEAKIDLIDNYHDREIAKIRLNYKKKIDSIKGNGEKQNELRMIYASKCEEDVANFELKYEQEKSRINLENKLSFIKEGSRTELELKLKQLKEQRDAELEAAKKTGADIGVINEKFNQKRVDIESEFAAKSIQNLQERYAYEQSIRDNEMLREIEDLRIKYSEELKLAGNNQEKRERLTEEFERKTAQISEKYAIKSAEASFRLLEGSLNQEGLTVKEREKIEADLAAAKIEFEKSVTEATINENERRFKSDQDTLEKRKAAIAKWLSIASDGLNAINDLGQAVFDSKIERIEEEQEANEEAGEKEQELISSLVEKKIITEEEGEARKRAAEEATAKKNEELEKKRASLKMKQAMWDKTNSLAQAGIATALAITQALPNIPLAILAGVMGAMQIATILATPIPKYAKGTDNHKGGPAIVGDGGRPEVILYNGGAWLTPDTPTLVEIPAGAAVIPNALEYDNNFVQELPMLPPASTILNFPESYNDRNIRRDISELARLIRMQTKQQHIDNYLTNYEIFKQNI